MITIYKYPLTLQHRQTVEMLEFAQILSVQLQGDQICIWAEVDTENETEQRTFLVYGTGHEITDNENSCRQFLGTVQQGRFVWHVFEIEEY